MTTFDPNSFVNTQFEGDLPTEYTPIPEAEYRAVVDKVEPDVTPQGSPLLRLTWVIDAEGNDEAHQRPVNQTLWLDLTESGALDRGPNKNVQLGRVLKAFNLHGKPWNAGMFTGMVATIKVGTRVDKQNPERVYNDVKGVTG